MDLRLENEKIRGKLARRIVDGKPRADEVDKFCRENDDVIQEVAHYIFSDEADLTYHYDRKNYKPLWRDWLRRMCHKYIKIVVSNPSMPPKEIEKLLVERGLHDD